MFQGVLVRKLNQKHRLVVKQTRITPLPPLQFGQITELRSNKDIEQRKYEIDNWQHTVPSRNVLSIQI